MAKTLKRVSLSVVVVADHRTDGSVISSGFGKGQFVESHPIAAFVGEDQDAVVEAARTAVADWRFQRGYENTVSRVDGQPYRLLLGKLTGVIKPVREYEVEAL